MLVIRDKNTKRMVLKRMECWMGINREWIGGMDVGNRENVFVFNNRNNNKNNNKEKINIKWTRTTNKMIKLQKKNDKTMIVYLHFFMHEIILSFSFYQIFF